MKVVALIQARMSSSRLAGKSLLPILGKPLAYRVVERVRTVSGVDDVVLATSSDVSDDVFAETMRDYGVTVFRGELDDVGQRFYDAALTCAADVFLRITGDNPLIDPGLMEALIIAWKKYDYEYVACQECLHGAGAELVSMAAFRRARSMVKDSFDREHVTPPIWKNEDQFRVHRVPVPEYLRPKPFVITVDTEEQYQQMVAWYEHFYRNEKIELKDVVESMI